MKTIVRITLGGLIMATLCFFVNKVHTKHIRDAHMVSHEFETELESYIINKTLREEINPDLTPVLIYRYNSKTGKGNLAGSGTIFDGSNGKQIVTSAHIFDTSVNAPLQEFIIRRLRPLERKDSIKYSIDSINSDSTNLRDYSQTFTDAVICKVGLKPKPVKSFYDAERKKEESQAEFHMYPIDNDKRLRSLVTGEYVPIIGVWQRGKDQLSYYLIINKSVPGESGTGFVDKDGGLYVLKGHGDPDAIPEKERRTLGYPKDVLCSIVVGGLRKQ